MSRPKGWNAFRNGGLALTTLILFVAGFEGALRLAGVHFPRLRGAGGAAAVAWVYDARLGWRNRADFTGFDYMGGPDRAAVRINSLGLRGAEPAERQAPRIAVFGDSFVFGTGVDEDHVFTTQLERVLRREGYPYDVVNLGVGGFSTDQEFLLFNEMAALLRPDIVVLVMCDNDFDGNLQDFAYGRYYKPYFRLESERLELRNQPVPTLSPAQRMKLWLGQRSEAWNFLRSRTRGRRVLFGFLQVGLARRPVEDPIEFMETLTRAFRDAVVARGARFVTLNTGHRGENTPLYHSLRPRLARADIAYLGLEGNLGQGRAQRPDLHWDFGRDSHWNRAAHRLAAEVVSNYLVGRKWVSAPAGSARAADAKPSISRRAARNPGASNPGR